MAASTRFGINLEEYAYWLLKPEQYGLVSAADIIEFRKAIEAIKPQVIPLKVKDKTFTTYKLTLPQSLNETAHSPLLKKAVIFIPPYRYSMAESLARLEQILKQLNAKACDTKLPVVYTGYIQEYRGRGENLHGEQFNKVSTRVDVEDQIELIKHVVHMDQHQKQDVLLCGEEAGANIAIWAKHILKNEVPTYSHLKICGMMALNNPLDASRLGPVIADKKIAFNELHKLGLMPYTEFHELLENGDVFFHTHGHEISINSKLGDVSVSTHDFSLVKKLHDKKSWNNAFITFSPTKSRHEYIAMQSPFKHLNEVSVALMMWSVLHKIPIKINFNLSLPEGYALKNEAKEGSDDYVKLTKEESTVMVGTLSCLIVHSNALTKIMKDLDDYASKTAKEARESGKGGEHSKFFAKVTAKQKMVAIMKLMHFMVDSHDLDLGKLEALKKETMDTGSTTLKEAYIQIENVVQDMAKLRTFNERNEILQEKNEYKPPTLK